VKFRHGAASIGLILFMASSLAACVGPTPNPPQQVGRAISQPTSNKPPLTLPAAIKRAVDLGPADTATTVFLSFGLKVRNAPDLAALIAAGKTISPDEYASRFGIDAPSVDHAVATLNAAGFRASWEAGSSVIAADGAAPVAASLLGVGIDNYRMPDGTTFYASLDQPKIPPQVAAVADKVSGLDNYRRTRSRAVPPGGLTATDLLAFYNIKPLRAAGLDGTGQTIVLPEIDDLPNLNDLNKFATKFGLPPYDSLLTVKRDPNWGTPDKPQGETVLDLEIIHEIAPNAKLVVYLSAADFAHGDRAFAQMVTDHLGSIISESLGSCEADTPSGHRDNYAAIEDRAVALGMSHFVASGDNGAYECGQDQPASGSFPSTLPTVTCVGGTTVFESEQGLYYQEYAWGSPIDESGSGGGASHFYTLPSYQKNVSNAAGHGFRQMPDVSANADPMSGFHIIFQGKDGQAGGTSASTPLWAAVVALINQDLLKKGLKEVGFANPALYWMGDNQSKLSAKPFHDVSAGNNLGYDAVPGWDFATGWGSMDAVALDAAWVTYKKSGGT
jgi:kumamolisin